MGVEYFVRYVLTAQEYRILLKRLGYLIERDIKKSSSLQAIFDGKMTVAVRQHIRLFVGIWASFVLFGEAVRLKSGPGTLDLDPKQYAAYFALTAGTYRAVYALLSSRYIQRFVESTGENVRHALRYAPATLAGIASGYAISFLPKDVRVYTSLYLTTKALEYVYNALADRSYFEWKSNIYGSWLVFPFSMAQLVPSLVQHPESCPRGFRVLMEMFRGGFWPMKPEGYPKTAPWPTDNEIYRCVGAAAGMAAPNFKSDIVYPGSVEVPTVFNAVQPILEAANPGHTSYVSAILHPQTTSAWQPLVETMSAGYKISLKGLLPYYLIYTVLSSKQVSPGVLNDAIANALRTATFITMTATSAWCGLRSSDKFFDRRIPATMRLRIIGFLSGFWAFIDQVHGRPRFFYALRLALLSQYNFYRNRHGNRGFFKRGEIYMASLAMGIIFAVFNAAPSAISSARLRRVSNWMQTGYLIDPAPTP